jgi:hypothetical protein
MRVSAALDVGTVSLSYFPLLGPDALMTYVVGMGESIQRGK